MAEAEPAGPQDRAVLASDVFGPRTRVVFLHAHPDDETLSTGALIAFLTAHGHPVAVVTATRGERGEVRPGVEVGDDLVAHRLDELAGALDALGVAEHCFLGSPPARATSTPRAYADSGMRWITPELAGPAEDAGTASLTAAGIAEPAADLAAYLRWFEADVLVSYDAHGGYGHPDHVACHEIAAATAAASGVALVEVVSEALLPDPGALLFSAPEQLPAVRHALGCYATQLQVVGDEVVHVGGQRQLIADAVRLRRARP